MVANGHLYLRDQDVLYCYDLRALEKAEADERAGRDLCSNSQDVVEKMLELAKVTMDDVVADLGCGDGRIVATAARKFGCRTIGYDLDPECVRPGAGRGPASRCPSSYGLRRKTSSRSIFPK